jgi:hypothetical protein
MYTVRKSLRDTEPSKWSWSPNAIWISKRHRLMSTRPPAVLLCSVFEISCLTTIATTSTPHPGRLRICRTATGSLRFSSSNPRTSCRRRRYNRSACSQHLPQQTSTRHTPILSTRIVLTQTRHSPSTTARTSRLQSGGCPLRLRDSKCASFPPSALGPCATGSSSSSSPIPPPIVRNPSRIFIRTRGACLVNLHLPFAGKCAAI